jgi:hypothetical protein
MKKLLPIIGLCSFLLGPSHASAALWWQKVPDALQRYCVQTNQGWVCNSATKGRIILLHMGDRETANRMIRMQIEKNEKEMDKLCSLAADHPKK